MSSHDHIVHVQRVEGTITRPGDRLEVNRSPLSVDQAGAVQDVLMRGLRQEKGPRPAHGNHPQLRIDPPPRRDSAPGNGIDAQLPRPQRVQAEQLGEPGRHLVPVEGVGDVYPREVEPGLLVRQHLAEACAREESHGWGDCEPLVGSPAIDDKSQAAILAADEEESHSFSPAKTHSK